MRHDKTSPLLELLNQRKAWAGPPYRLPEYSPNAKIANAATALRYAAANRSDPFAFGRATLHLSRGLFPA